MKPKISIITLGVDNIEKSLIFYRDGLGLKPHNYKEGDDMIFLEMEGTFLGLYPKEKMEEEFDKKLGETPSPVVLAHNEPSKEVVDKVIEEARTAGAVILKEPQDTFWGGYSGYFADPDGHTWEVAYNPFTDLT